MSALFHSYLCGRNAAEWLIQMNKNEFVAAIAEKSGLTKKDAEAALNAYTEVVTDALKAGDSV